MRKILSVLSILFLLTSNSWATVGWNKSIPATSENPQAISSDVIQNNTAVDLMLQNYRDGYVTISLASTSLINIGTGGVMLQNSGGSVRLMVANSTVTAVGPTNIDIGTISASATYYLYAYASSTTATTFSVIFSASSTSPTGITYFHRLGSFTTDINSNFVNVHNDIYGGFGVVSNTNSFGVTYQAATDGFVMSDCLNGQILCEMGSSSPSEITGNYSTNVAGCSMAVPKGYYWEVLLNSGCSNRVGGPTFVPSGS